MKPDADHLKLMRLALRLAERGRGYVEPNPLVGCVIVKGGRIVGQGYHRRFGGPHAEIEALSKAGRQARGATVYVTLEPCCHHGKTGPCTDALIQAAVRRVLAACRDPFPQVAGKGIARLRKAGIDVQVGLCRQQAQQLNAPFFNRVRTGLPYVIAKWAMTLDGAIATGQSKWISGQESRRRVHELRGRVDAIVVGIGTVLADDPMLTAREVRVRRVARRVVIDPSLRIPLGSRLVRSADRAPVTVVTGPEKAKSRRLRGTGVEVMSVPRLTDGLLDLRSMLRQLSGQHGASNVLVEGGGKTLGAFYAQKLVDEAWVFIAPKVVGDAGAVRPVVLNLPSGPSVLRGAASHRLASVQASGPDVWVRYALVHRASRAVKS